MAYQQSTNDSIEAQVAFKGGVELINAGNADGDIEHAVRDWLLARLVGKQPQPPPAHTEVNEWFVRYACLVLGESKVREIAGVKEGDPLKIARALRDAKLTEFELKVGLALREKEAQK